MTGYQVIARKFRPQKFLMVSGQEAIVTTLKNAIKQNHLSHAYLFSGLHGTGKTTLARLLAKALNCLNLTDDIEPCGECKSCKEIVLGSSLDVIEIDGASNRGIDDIRQLNETVRYATFNGKYKIFLIDEVHMLTKEAFNALLKTLEEPPKNVKFFLATTEPHKIPSTILSRCQRFDLNRIEMGAIIKKMRMVSTELGLDIEDEALSLIAKVSEGSLRDAESLLERVSCFSTNNVTKQHIEEILGLLPKELFFALDKAYEKCNLAAAFDISSKLFTAGHDTSHFIEMLIDHYRTIIRLHLGEMKEDYLSKSEIEGYTLAHKTYSKEICLDILEYLSQILFQPTKLVFRKTYFEMILLHIIQMSRRISIDQIVKKLYEVPSTNETLPSPEPVKLQVEEVPDINASQTSFINEPKIEAPIATSVEKKVVSTSTAREETLLRFAAVELSGTLKRH